MKVKKDGHRQANWGIAWVIQILSSLAAGMLTALMAGLHPIAGSIALWLFMPCAGAFTAFRAVRRGLLNYAAWIAPPACLYAANILIWGYAPPAGGALFCAFLSLTGAAAGEVYNQQHK